MLPKIVMFLLWKKNAYMIQWGGIFFWDFIIFFYNYLRNCILRADYYLHVLFTLGFSFNFYNWTLKDLLMWCWAQNIATITYVYIPRNFTTRTFQLFYWCLSAISWKLFKWPSLQRSSTCFCTCNSVKKSAV